MTILSFCLLLKRLYCGDIECLAMFAYNQVVFGYCNLACVYTWWRDKTAWHGLLIYCKPTSVIVTKPVQYQGSDVFVVFMSEVSYFSVEGLLNKI